MADADKGGKPTTDVDGLRPNRVRSIWGVGYIKRKIKERASQKKAESTADKAARITATATKWMAVFTFLLFLVTGGTLIILRNQLQEMRGSGTQTDKIISAANLIEDHQKQMVKDNKQVLSDNRNALADSLKENRTELGSVLRQNRGALEISAAQSKAALDATVKAATEQSSLMRHQLELTDRAWLRIDVTGNLDLPPTAMFPTTLSFDANGRGNLGRTVILHNVGRSVATDVHIRDTLIVRNPQSPIDFKLPISRQQEFCAALPSPNAATHTVFPDTPIKSYEVSSFETKEVPDPPEINRLQLGKPISLYLVGCVDYRYGSTNTKHETGFVLEVFGGTGHEGIQVKGSYPPEALTFLPFFLGGDYAY